MAPDLNSVPASPRPSTDSTRQSNATLSNSRRASQQMPPPPLPLSPVISNILPSNQQAVANMPPLHSPGLMPDQTAVGIGPGPLRHPRPLTAAELHMQLEKEQEAVVNRLTRELSLLRAAANASVASNSSSTSATSGIPDSTDTNANHLLSGPSHPVPSTRRHQRSGSATSTRSITGTSVTDNNIAGVAPERPRVNMQRQDSNPLHSLSRQNSVTSSRRSGASSPAPEYFPYGHSSRAPPYTFSRERSSSSVLGVNSTEPERERATTSVPMTGRHDELVWQRMEMEAAKRENEMLKRRIRELEQQLRNGRGSDASGQGGSAAGSVRGRERSESASTAASVQPPREAGGASSSVSNVRTGESAGDGGL